jgi:hypothetical protein
LISPTIFNELFRPALKRIIDCVKDFDSELLVAFHSDGAITAIIPGLIDTGVDVPPENVVTMFAAAGELGPYPPLR